MKCIHRQVDMTRSASPFHLGRKAYHLLLDAVPGWVCSQCGEPYFEETEVESIQEAIRVLDRQASKLATSA